MDKELNQWAAILHASQLAGQVVPLAGFVVPLIIWQIKKETMPSIDDHGRQAMNWIITFVLYSIALGVGFFVLFFLFPPIIVLAIPVAIFFGIIGLVFPIIAAVKASEGEVWVYPGAIQFL